MAGNMTLAGNSEFKRWIRQWYEFYYQRITIWQQPVAKLGEDNGQQLVAQLDDVNMQQPVAQISEEVFFSVPWGHQSYQEEANRQPYHRFAYLQNEEQCDGAICP